MHCNCEAGGTMPETEGESSKREKNGFADRLQSFQRQMRKDF